MDDFRAQCAELKEKIRGGSNRPEPPSLAEQALSAFYAITSGADDTREFYQDVETVKAALERLQELESNQLKN